MTEKRTAAEEQPHDDERAKKREDFLLKSTRELSKTQSPERLKRIVQSPIDRAFDGGKRTNRRPDAKMPKDHSRDVGDAPLDFHPDTAKGETPAAQRVRAGLKFVFDSWNAVAKAARDPNVPRDELARLSTRAVEKALSAVDRSRDQIESDIVSIEQRIDATIAPKIDPQLASEIRAHWRVEKMKKGDSELGMMSKLNDQVRKNIETASAVLTGPAYLSGLSEANRKLLRDIAIEAHAKPEKAILVEAQQSLAKLQRAGERLLATLGPKLHEWSTPNSEALSALKEAAQ